MPAGGDLGDGQLPGQVEAEVVPMALGGCPEVRGLVAQGLAAVEAVVGGVLVAGTAVGDFGQQGGGPEIALDQQAVEARVTHETAPAERSGTST